MGHNTVSNLVEDVFNVTARRAYLEGRSFPGGLLFSCRISSKQKECIRVCYRAIFVVFARVLQNMKRAFCKVSWLEYE